jgi:hypothetical protein
MGRTPQRTSLDVRKVPTTDIEALHWNTMPKSR